METITPPRRVQEKGPRGSSGIFEAYYDAAIHWVGRRPHFAIKPSTRPKTISTKNWTGLS